MQFKTVATFMTLLSNAVPTRRSGSTPESTSNFSHCYVSRERDDPEVSVEPENL